MADAQKEKSLSKAAKLIESASEAMKAKQFSAALSNYEQAIEFFYDVLSCE